MKTVIEKLQEAVKEATERKEYWICQQDFEQAAALRDLANRLRKEIEALSRFHQE